MKNWQEFVDKIGQNRIRQTELAKLYLEVEQTDELINIIKQARAHKIPAFIIGSGSWPQIPKTQINGLLIKNNCRRFDIYAMSGKIKEQQVGIAHKLIYAQSGTNMNQLVRFAIEEGLGGLEYHLGLPGTVGGAIYTNAKYAPKSIYVNDAVDNISILNKENEMQQVSGDYFVSRATSEFSATEDVIISAVFRLVPEDKNLLWERAREATEYRSKQVNK